MLNSTEIRTDHKDVIHDVSYDYYGKRMATCSSDQTVKVQRNCNVFHGPSEAKLAVKTFGLPSRSGTSVTTAHGP